MLLTAIAMAVLLGAFAARGAQDKVLAAATAVVASFLGAHVLAATRVAQRDEAEWFSARDVVRELPAAVCLVGLPLGLTWAVVQPLLRAHQYFLGAGAAAVLTGLPVGVCLVAVSFACIHYVRVREWRESLKPAALLATVVRYGLIGLAVGLSALIGIVAFVPLAIAAAAYGGWLYHNDEGEMVREVSATGVAGLAEAVSSKFAGQAYRRLSDAADESLSRAKVRLHGLGRTVLLTFVAALLAVPYCYVVVLGRMAANACAGRRVDFSMERAADALAGDDVIPDGPMPQGV